jgi:manganese transport protein
MLVPTQSVANRPAPYCPSVAAPTEPSHSTGVFVRRAPEAVPKAAARAAKSFAGVGSLIAVGYVDPGNWATDLAAGSRYGYELLWVVLASSLIGLLLQALSVRLGVATGRNLAEVCREAYPRLRIPLWITAEVAIAATDLAELLGSAIALELLLGIPLWAGVLLTTVDVLALLGLGRVRGRVLERIVLVLGLAVGAGFAFELALSHPAPGAVLAGFLPTTAIVHDGALATLAVGILGATVMPHNLYLHSHVVNTRAFAPTPSGRLDATRRATWDTVVSLGVAMAINLAILVVAASTFHSAHFEVAELSDAHALLRSLLGSRLAPIVFALALLAAGQSAAVTGTMAGDVVMTGFLRLRLTPWIRRVATRGLALGPALAATLAAGDHGAGRLLIASQVVLSLQLGFAVVPLVLLVSDRRRVGGLALSLSGKVIAWSATVAVLAVNALLLASLAR